MRDLGDAVHLLGKAQIVIPEWEPDQGWRVLDPDGHVVSAGPRTLVYATFEIPGFGDDEVPLLDGGDPGR